MTAWSPWERRLCFILPFSMRVCLCMLRAANLGGGDPAAFKHVVLQVSQFTEESVTVSNLWVYAGHYLCL